MAIERNGDAPRLSWQWDPRRRLVRELDGDGAADLAYVEDGKVTVSLNQSGFGWGEPIVLGGPPPVTDFDAIHLTVTPRRAPS